jgi:hypothetical protein
MKINELIDYLNQFDENFEVTIGPKRAGDTADYIDLEVVIPDGDADPATTPVTKHCRYCDRPIEMREDGWASPDADNSDDDPYCCEEHDAFMADHEPKEES